MDVVWQGRNNVIDKVIIADESTLVDAPTPLSGANKLLLKLTDKSNAVTSFNSDTNPTFFSTDTTKTYAGEDVRVVTLKLGSAGLALGDYDAVLTAFDATHTLGLVIGEFRISVRAPQ